ncbi:isoleucine--tRNA ligase [Curtanaerobium respiraculi]|uniref:isoleucine--tRNA ligase n=1 Tax=Curtanaerobium respiraculi TaxID=2949669 RepID=UPI0024B33C13|nr:isoleucine--tRNA ligase [Curtanaerobium respiraculi]
MANAYKNTMILPKTDFAMRANLPQKEPARLQWWDDIDIYHKVLEKNKDGEPFVLHDGPPYANGPIHIGHAFNKILKDFVNKVNAQRGYFTPYIPGWDCHGQPIEHEVEKKVGTEKMNALPQSVIRKMCREWAEKFVDVQRDGFRRLGVNADWQHPYLTFQPSYESANVEVFKKMYLDGAVYRGRKPIHWCTHCHTALAEAEIEYGDEVSPAIFVRFELTTTPSGLEAYAGSVDVAIWTTTPWTLPADDAVILHPDEKYVAVLHDGRPTIFAEALAGKCCERFGWEHALVEGADGEPWSAKGIDLAGNEYKQPIFGDRGATGVFIYADYVTMEDGTGIVHSAPGHGVDDYNAGMKFGVPVVMPVDDDGRFYEGEGMGTGGPFSGMEVNEANPVIVEWLRERGTLIMHEDISHSYPHCWRCHQPVIFRATNQWFVSMDSTGLREKALDEIHRNVEFVPQWGVNRIGSMIEDRPDWCISRQRSWGVPIPVFTCAKCGETIATEETFDAVIDLFNSEGADAWFTKKPMEYLPAGTCCPACGASGADILPEKDILDVWWESGVSHVGVLRHRADQDRLRWPADMYLEGSDQHRGWFQSSLLCGVGAYGTAPFKRVVCCGFTMDENGEKMSKSKGNGVDPAVVCGKYGADVLRLWVASTDYSVDVNVGETVLKRTSDAYRRFRNTLRFLLGSLDDFDDEACAVREWDALQPAGQWALARLAQVLQQVDGYYDAYQYHRVYRVLYDYVGELSSAYLDQLKDRLYSEAVDSPLRRAAQTVVFQILEVLVRVLAPILSFTTEEAWQQYPPLIRDRAGRPESVQLAGWPRVDGFVPTLPADADRVLSDFDVVLSAREAVTKAIEDARAAGLVSKSQEAEAALTVPAAALPVLQKFDAAFFSEFFIVAAVSFTAGDGDEYSCAVSKTELEKCPRCWNHRPLGGNAHHPGVCERCGDVLDGLGFSEE